MYIGVINIYVSIQKKANCPKITTFFLYFHHHVKISRKYVSIIVIHVPIRVIIDKNNGNIGLIFVPIFDLSNSQTTSMFIRSEEKNNITIIIILHIIQAIKAQREFIKTSWIDIFLGQNDIYIKLIIKVFFLCISGKYIIRLIYL